jgi:polar amino acid transport system substrate-binding protein
MPKPTSLALSTPLALMLTAALVAACAAPAASPSVGPSTAASVAASASAEPTPDPCASENMATKTPGTLTIGTDNPAFPPYFDPPKGDEKATDPWEFGDPTNGRGFESAIAYAVANELGFTRDSVEWTVVPFNSSFRPGDKPFDIYLAQVSYDPERAKNADLSDGYYSLNQALVATSGSALAGATTIADVAQHRLGVQIGTTSLAYIEEQIQPAQEPRVYDTNNATLEGLKSGQVEGIVVDLPTAFYMTAVQYPKGVIVGQFPPAGEKEHFSFVLELDSPLTDCVNQAIAALKNSGELDDITQKWMSDKADAPFLE